MRKFSAVLASSVLLFACSRAGDGGGTNTGKTVTSISLSPATFALAIGGTQGLQVSAVFSDNSTAIITTAGFVSSAPGVATVSSSGTVTGVTAGTATITATQGSATATARVTVNAAGPATSLVIFDDDFGTTGVSYGPFSGANPTIDSSQHTIGNTSLKVVDPATGFVGGAFKLAPAVDASNFTAVTFWAMASVNHTVDKFGLGNDTASSALEVDWLNVPLTTTWTKLTLPLPLASKLTALTGGFLYAQNGGANFTFWLDQIQYENIAIPAPVLAMPNQTLSKGVGDKIVMVPPPPAVSPLTATYTLGGSTVALAVWPRYFTFTNSNPAVATIDQDGNITCVGNGTTNITAKLGTAAVAGTIAITVAAGNAPSTAAPTPTVAAANVKSMFSDAYDNVFVANWNSFGNGPTETDLQIAGNNVKEYTNLDFAGVDITGGDASKVIDASAMTFFHLDYWTPDATDLKVKLVDFGSDGVFHGTGADSESELDFPAPVKGQWNSLEIPLSQFTGLTSRSHIAQLIPSGSNGTGKFTLYIDNVFFHSGAATGGSGGGGGGTPPPTSFAVFADAYPAGVAGFAPFGSASNDINVDSTVAHSGTSSLKVIIPVAAGFTGGALVLPAAQDLSGTNALTFWAKASSAKTIDNAGLANDANGDVTWSVQLNTLSLTTDWKQFVIPLPDASKLTAVKGVFYFATGSDPNGVIFWIDDVQYGVLGSAVLGTGQPDITTASVTHAAGETFAVPQPIEKWFLNGGSTATSFNISPRYLSYVSSDPSVATVDLAGNVQALKAGTANLTATFNGAAAEGEISLTVGAQPVPTVAAPTPTAAGNTVISMFSNAYDNVSVANWNAFGNGPVETDLQVAGNDVKKYTNLDFAGVDISGGVAAKCIDATGMAFFHLDYWTPDATDLKVKLVDFGSDGVFQGAGADTESELDFPAPVKGQWNSLDIPLSQFTHLGSRSHLAQLIPSGNAAGGKFTLYIDNVYFHQ